MQELWAQRDTRPTTTYTRPPPAVMTTPEATKPLSPIKEPPRPSKPNFARLYAKPFPLNTYPLPPLIPHNAFSVLHIAFTYIYHHIARASSHPKIPYQAYFSPETRSIHVTDQVAIRALWESGFFGKGSLSRSEPTWLDREKRRRGLLANETSEEVTRQRREERKKFKKERARKEREAIEEKLKEEEQSKQNSGIATRTARARYEGIDGGPVESLAKSIEPLIAEEPTNFSDLPPMVITKQNGVIEEKNPTATPSQLPNSAATPTQWTLEPEAAAITNQEQLHLTPSEAFFLAYGLGVLQILDPKTHHPLTISALFTLFRQTSYFPPRQFPTLSPDDPFLVDYITYHHFRSLGWVVRPGIKFAVDWLLYLRGPVFSHAEFAVTVIPAYRHPYWRSSEALKQETLKKERKTWWWLHCLNRVQSQVRKSLVLVYVEVPPPSALATCHAGDTGVVDIGRFFKTYKVRELTLKRWIPNRERD
ncbi:hypothetical protein N7G274_006610 [Stereocaulon virgatum]|uniref:tRNA-splicing endonuclease subunit Sen2 n=1 Tax=Stereocaulon virgatum TaxID=373712 RepID=A0ABR4A5L1_9LECA